MTAPRRLLLLALLLALPVACADLARGAEPSGDYAIQKVLILSSYDVALPAIALMNQSIRATLRKDAPGRIVFYQESMDSFRIPQVRYEEMMIRLLKQKYEGEKIDLIFALGAPALRILTKHRAELLPDTPIIFYFYSEEVPDPMGPRVTGISEAPDYAKTLDLALAIQPETRRVVVVAGNAEQDRLLLAEAGKAYRPYEATHEFTYLTDLTMDEMRQQVASLPAHSVVIFLSFMLDRNGKGFSGPEALSLLAPASSAPIYSISRTYLGNGIVGGSLLDFEAIGARMGEMGKRIINGERPEEIAPQSVPSVAMFDWRALKRWGISEQSLPPGSIVEFRQPSFWKLYKWYILTAVAVTLLETMLIAGLLINRARRRQAEENSKSYARLAEEERRRLDDVISNVPGIVWETHPVPGQTRRHLEFVSDYVEKMLGYSVEEWLSTPGFWFSTVPDEDKEWVSREIQKALMTSTKSVIQFRWRAKDGRLLWAEAHMLPILNERGEVAEVRGVTIDITERKQAEQTSQHLAALVESSDDAIISKGLDGTILSWNRGAERLFGYQADEAIGRNISLLFPEDRLNEEAKFLQCIRRGERVSQLETIRKTKDGREINIAVTVSPIKDHSGQIIAASKIARDITRRKQVEAALRESEQRFRHMADTAPMLIWMSDHNKECIYFNKRWLDFTGRSLEQELGNGWAESIHPEDRLRCLETYYSAFDRREPFQMEYRLRRADGEFRWLLDSGTPRLSPTGKFLGYIGSCVDITERKQAEQALEGLSGQLIRAREDECARIARELHDDISQKVALISLEVDLMRQRPPDSQAELNEMAQGILKQAAELSSDIHRMSHDLHPSKLKHLGLVAALKSLCIELSHGYGLSIAFTSADLPTSLPPDLSLCLYRVVQESLNNVVRHSRANEAQVELHATGSEIQLRIEDTGSGFEVESARSRKGIGLIGMRERLRLVGGTISIESRLGQGTSIDVRVPLARTAANTDEMTPSGKGQAA